MRTAESRLHKTRRIEIDPGWLRDAYIVRGMSMSQIGRELGASPKTVHRRLHILGIPVRAPGAVGSRSPHIRPEDVLTMKFLSDAIGRKRMSLSEISRQTGITQGTVGRYAHRYGIPVRTRIYDVDSLYLADRVQRGWTDAQIAAEVGCGENTITQRLSEHGLRTTRNRDRDQIDKDELARLVKPGWSQERMANHFGCAQSTVGRRVRSHGF
jgi:transcriptional regulator with XRE-family HTH domain